MTKTKVFVGNLSFKTSEADLRKEFEVAGKVESANIITRGSRSLGYGFVEMATLDEANKSVELLHKKLVDNREINVEVARPREDKPVQEPRPPRQPRQPREPREQGQGQQQQGDNNGQPVDGRPPRGRGIRRGRGGRGGRGGNNNGAPNAAAGAAAQGAVQGGVAGAGPAQGQRPPRQPRAPRAPRPPRSDQPRTPSTNTLYVSNLPFSVDDAKLSEIFQGLNVKQAHVVRKPNSRSKGFGFVEFNNSEDQQKALQSIGTKTVEGRELTVRVAMTEIPKPEGSASPAPAGAGAASPAVSAPASTGAASPAVSAPAAQK